jgi:hypothetical protein
MQAILTAWYTHENSGTPEVKEVKLVAVPARLSMGCRGEVEVDGQTSAIITVSAVDGAEFGYDDNQINDAFDHHPIGIVAYEMEDNPETTVPQSFWGLPGSSFGKPFNPPPGNQFLRLGDDRAAVYDFQEDNNSAPKIWTTLKFYPFFNFALPYSIFIEQDKNSYAFKSQNIYHKLRSALGVIDPLKPLTGWDHHPNAPFSSSDKAPLSVFTNVDSSPEGNENNSCNGAPGKFWSYKFGNEWKPTEHPYISGNYKTAVIGLCKQDESVLFHELGHYYDSHTTYGVMGDGLVSGTCNWDTPDESIALKETVADMTALYIYRKLYQTLSYDFSSSHTACEFTDLGIRTFRIHCALCTINDNFIGNFQEDRPLFDTNDPCQVSMGYNQPGIIQAFWEFINGKLCDPQAPYNCVPTGVDADLGMKAMLYALSLSNLQSYKQFFENMGVYIFWYSFVFGNNEIQYYEDIMSHHGIIDAN